MADQGHQHGEGGCRCATSNSGVQQTIDELEFERGIWTAAIDNDLDRVEKFLRQGKVNAKDNFGFTALHYAARAGYVALCDLLIRNGAEVDSATRAGGVTALQRAATKGHLDVVRLLVEKGRADVKLRDSDGKTALHRAVEGEHPRVVEYLLAREPTLRTVEDAHGKTPCDLAGEGDDEMRKAFEENL